MTAARTIRCSHCNGTNVQIAVWMDPNTKRVLDLYGYDEMPEGRWCRDCNDTCPWATGYEAPLAALLEKDTPAQAPGYTVSLIHEGTDWAVLPAGPDESPDCVWESHAEACAAARRNAKDQKCSWFDMTEGGAA